VPVKTDNGMIWLSDVAISKPMSRHLGVVQYDHGKAETGHFKCTGALAPPLVVLLNAQGSNSREHKNDRYEHQRATKV
jgi:hypothetical protein